ncbi:MAG: hypothetical protein ACTSRP_21220 [Candidatus Helarchaeota archaeon]
MGLRKIESDIEFRAQIRKKSPEFMIKELESMLKTLKELLLKTLNIKKN